MIFLPYRPDPRYKKESGMKPLLSFSGGYSGFTHDHPWISILCFVAVGIAVAVLKWIYDDRNPD
jgi:hypothetical protein